MWSLYFLMILFYCNKRNHIKSWKNITVQISNDKVLKKSWNIFSSNMCFENKRGFKYLHDMFLYWITVVPLLKDNPFCNEKNNPISGVGPLEGNKLIVFYYLIAFEILPDKEGYPYKGVTSLEGGHFIVFYYLIEFEILLDKRGGFNRAGLLHQLNIFVNLQIYMNKL